MTKLRSREPWKVVSGSIWIGYWVSSSFGSVNRHDLRPYVEQLAICRFKISFPLRSYLLFLCSIKSLMLIGALLRCFDTAFFQRPYRYFSIALKVVFSLSDHYKIFTSNWLWIEICKNVVWSKIDITMTTINKKTLKLIKAEFCLI